MRSKWFGPRVLPVHFASRQITATAEGIAKQLSIEQRTR
jgi:hypothetical protein